jgi:uncharacterized protein YycO
MSPPRVHRVLLYEGVSLLSKAIQWRTWGPYSHAALQLADGQVIDAWKGGVRKIKGPFVGHDKKTRVLAYDIRDLTATQAEAMAKFAMAQIGKGYDYLGVMRFLTRRDANNGKWFCSELVAAAACVAGRSLLEKPSHRISPSDLASSTELRFSGYLGSRTNPMEEPK